MAVYAQIAPCPFRLHNILSVPRRMCEIRFWQSRGLPTNVEYSRIQLDWRMCRDNILGSSSSRLRHPFVILSLAARSIVGPFNTRSNLLRLKRRRPPDGAVYCSGRAVVQASNWLCWRLVNRFILSGFGRYRPRNSYNNHRRLRA